MNSQQWQENRMKLTPEGREAAELINRFDSERGPFERDERGFCQPWVQSAFLRWLDESS